MAEVRILVKGLVSAAHYNGLIGTVTQSDIDKAKSQNSRIKVLLDTGKYLRIKKKNISALTVDDILPSLAPNHLQDLINQAGLSNESKDIEVLRSFVKENVATEDILNIGKFDPESTSAQQEVVFERIKQMNSNGLVEHLKSQLELLKQHPEALDSVKGGNPAFSGLTYNEMIKHLEMMTSLGGDTIKKMSQGSLQATKEQMNHMMTNMGPAQMRQMIQAQLDMIESNPAAMEEMRRSNPQAQHLSIDSMKKQLLTIQSFTDEQLVKLIEMQRSGKMTAEVMRDPELMRQIVENNHDMKSKENKVVEKTVEKVKESTQEEIETATKITENIEAVTNPLSKVLDFLNKFTFGHAKVTLTLSTGVLIVSVLYKHFT